MGAAWRPATSARAPALQRLGLGRGKFAGLNGVSETASAVGAIAEGLIGGLATPAQGDRGAAGKAEGLAAGILNLKFAFDANRAVVNDGNFGSHISREAVRPYCSRPDSRRGCDSAP